MRGHWANWVEESLLDELKARDVERVRLPIGDWTINQYGPYVGCMDGAAEQVDQFLDWAAARNISVWLDVHTARGSQNGFDNGGRTQLVTWTDETHYTHDGNTAWLGTGDHTFIDYAHIKWSLDQMEAMLQRWGSHSALIGFEPVNEPDWNTNAVILKDYYREVRRLVRRYAPNSYFVFHNSFHKEWDYWQDLFAAGDTAMTAVDHHGYFAWQGKKTVADACEFIQGESDFAADFRAAGIEVWWGEWSLATDTCAMWLGGFNAGNVGDATCERHSCPESYMPPDMFNTTFDRDSVDILGPYGADDMSQIGIANQTCWDDSKHFSFEEVGQIAACTLQAFNEKIDGHFLWTAHNEIEDKWSYMNAFDLGWIDQSQSAEGKAFIQ